MDLEQLEQDLASLSPHARIAFAALCCERLVPNYQAFELVEKWGDVSVLYTTLDFAWEYAQGKDAHLDQVIHHQELCEAVAPDSEIFQTIFAGLALHAVSAICSLLEFMISQDVQSIMLVVGAAFESIDEYLNRIADPILDVHGSDVDFDKWVQSAPLFKMEMVWQEDNLKMANAILEMDSFQIAEIRRKEGVKGIQPLLRGLVRPT